MIESGQAVAQEERQATDFEDIHDMDMDLSPLVVERVRYGGVALRAAAPIWLKPTMDASQQLLCVEQADLGIDVFAYTRQHLLTELAEQLAMLWREYALADDAILDKEARNLKQALLNTFVVEASYAA